MPISFGSAWTVPLANNLTRRFSRSGRPGCTAAGHGEKLARVTGIQLRWSVGAGFLSYRRGDAGGYAGRLTDGLLQRLGPKSVFQDVTAISPGQDYTVVIDRALADSDVALAVIGPGWVTAVTPQGTRRLLEDDDYVHLELAGALRRGIRVIPVLVGGAQLQEAGSC